MKQIGNAAFAVIKYRHMTRKKKKATKSVRFRRISPHTGIASYAHLVSPKMSSCSTSIQKVVIENVIHSTYIC